jgi:stage II sporulation protein D
VLLDSCRSGGQCVFSIDGAYRIFKGGSLHAYEDEGFSAYGYRLGRASASLHEGGVVAVNGTPLGENALCLAPEKQGSIRIGQTRYSGLLLIEDNGSGGVRLVNCLDVEDYLASVLFREMPASFPDEALKCQAVAARTYAVHMSRKGDGLLMPDDRSQVYGGTAASTDRSRQIVSATAGEVLVYEGAILPAYYSSTCGGMTVRADDVFLSPSPAPLNNNTACGFCSRSPYYRWSAVFPLGEIVEKFELAGICRSPEIGVTATDPARRATEISILDPQGNVLQRFDAGSFRRVVNSGRPLRKRMLSTRIDQIVKTKKHIRIEGGGFGHGVGMCQYGSRGLAARGDTYADILAFYYKGCTIDNLQDLINAESRQQ